MRTSVVIPAHNESAYLASTLRAVDAARFAAPGEVEVVVVANRCTDSTMDVAMAGGATVVTNSARNIAAVRNAGVASTTGEVVVTVDADCLMHPLTLGRVNDLLSSGDYVGGGVRVVPERLSLGIRATYTAMELAVRVSGLAGGLFWTLRNDFEAVGGFDESQLVGEDLGFARSLRRVGRATGRKFTNLRDVPLTASCRKFDRYGDWHMFAMAKDLPQIYAAVKGTDTSWVDRYFFDFND